MILGFEHIARFKHQPSGRCFFLLRYTSAMRNAIWTGVFVGSFLGSLIPELWGAGFLSFSSMFFSAVGAFAGIWAAWRLTH